MQCNQLNPNPNSEPHSRNTSDRTQATTLLHLSKKPLQTSDSHGSKSPGMVTNIHNERRPQPAEHLIGDQCSQSAWAGAPEHSATTPTTSRPQTRAKSVAAAAAGRFARRTWLKEGQNAPLNATLTSFSRAAPTDFSLLIQRFDFAVRLSGPTADTD